MGNSIFICMLILKLYMKYFYFMLLFVKKKMEIPDHCMSIIKAKIDGMSWEIRIKHFLNERQISMHRNLRSGCTDDRSYCTYLDVFRRPELFLLKKKRTTIKIGFASDFSSRLIHVIIGFIYVITLDSNYFKKCSALIKICVDG
jgi:hypothetical protein